LATKSQVFTLNSPIERERINGGKWSAEKKDNNGGFGGFNEIDYSKMGV
jgi:hypothetical protein